ncbi:uncharacterized protein isoform X2 [Rhodnius prolixus]
MELKEWLKNKIDNYNSEHDEIVDKMIYHEYYYLLIFALFYLKVTPKALILHSLQLMFYVVILAVHVYYAIISIFKEIEFIFIINLAHLIYITLLTMVLPITITKNRQEMSIVHKIIGTGTYDYKEEIPDEEHTFTKKYLMYKKILKNVLPGINLFACMIAVFVGPWIDGFLSGKVEIRDYDDEATVAACTCIFLHLIIQLERLIISANNMQQRALKLYNLGPNKPSKIQNIDKLYEDSEFMKTLEYCFKQIIEHHQQIIRMCSLFNEICSVPLFASLFSGGVVLGLSSLIVIVGTDKPTTAVGTLIMAYTELVNIFAVCKLGQTVTDLNEKFREEVQNLAWYHFSAKFKASMMIVQEYNRQELQVTGAFKFKANMVSFSGILNAAYSYFSVLLAFKNKMHKHLLNMMKYILVITVGSGVAMVAVSGFLALSLADRPGGLLGLFIMCGAQISNILSVCYLGELVSDMNNQLNFELYSVNWYCYTKKIHQYLNIIQIYTTKDMAVTGPFSLIANMETFGKMMNSAYSYMSLLFAWNSS